MRLTPGIELDLKDQPLVPRRGVLNRDACNSLGNDSCRLSLAWCPVALADEPAQPFGTDFPNLDSLAVGEWWTKTPRGPNPPPPMDVPRDQVVAFALYTHDNGILKLTAQLYPLKPGEPREARLEFQRDGQWTEAAKAPVLYPGWSAHFRIDDWDANQDVPYRVRHGETAMFEGLIRRDPRDKDVIVVANMSCNSSRTTGLRPEIIENLKRQNPDLLFFAGDQTYRHTEHTAGWIEFGLQFRDLMRDRPTITIPDDHDVGHPNLWGENGKRSLRPDNADGGYFYPVEYVNMVQRQQTWHLPDPVDPAPVERGISVYFTRLRVGGVDFAILEDRKFKSGPQGKIPQQGPRPDHINEPGIRSEDRSICRTGAARRSAAALPARVGRGLDRRGDESRALANGVLRRGPPARNAQQSAAGRPGLQRLAAKRSQPRARGHPPRVGRASVRRPAPGRRREARHRGMGRRAVRLHQSGAGEHDLRPLVASAGREAGAESRARKPAAVDGRFQRRPRQQDLDARLRQSEQHPGRARARRRLRHRAIRQTSAAHHLRMLAAICRCQ